MEQSKTRNHRARHKTRASLLSDKGLDAANHNPRFRRREKNVLDIPSYRTGDRLKTLPTHTLLMLASPRRFAVVPILRHGRPSPWANTESSRITVAECFGFQI